MLEFMVLYAWSHVGKLEKLLSGQVCPINLASII
jgi:hypothetical protein